MELFDFVQEIRFGIIGGYELLVLEMFNVKQSEV